MTVNHASVAGTLESSDIMITLNPSGEPGIDIDLKSTVIKQFGGQIRREIETALREMGIDSVKVVAVDKGAQDCAIRARVRAAACRALDQKTFEWEGIGHVKTA